MHLHPNSLGIIAKPLGEQGRPAHVPGVFRHFDPNLVIREMLFSVEGFADGVIIPENGQLIANLEHGVRLGGHWLSAVLLHKHDQDTGICAQLGLGKAEALVFFRDMAKRHLAMVSEPI